ncbi:MAG: protein-L-isoaspartate(D-aspartate) O-methyltransferase [Hyphomicrobiales bacterium]|nr:protein-L-isoaspartate(D-aspartate) O-methyltransferase [Hyphomicrobiales bacterium]MCP5372710.1 protein-L-isoaspartate(D-aspartate) O-methyltransferase [Hyphomicrobiales bacterium]
MNQPPSRKIRLLLELRRKGITDTRVLAAIERVPRQEFIPEQFHDQAYMDRTLPIGHHQTISAPSVVARMSEALCVGERMKVLEIGTGSGYQAAILAGLCRRLYTIERHKPLLEVAERRFAALRLTNITAIAGDGYAGWPEQAPFDRIIITAAAPQVPVVLVGQLAVGGILVAPIGDEGAEQRLVRVRRTDDGGEAEDLGPVRFVPMVPGLA